MEKEVMEDLFRIQCEKILNETWAKALIHYDKIKEIVEHGDIRNETDKIVLLIAANAALQKMTLDRAVDSSLNLSLNEEMSLCGQNKKHQCPCNREVCLMEA